MARSRLIVLSLALVALYSLSGVQAEQKRLSGLDWDVWFERLVGLRKYDLDGPVLMQILMRLHKGSYQQISSDKKSIVDFWLDANVGNHEHCSSEFMTKLKSEHKRLVNNGYKKADEIYSRTEWRVIGNCYSRLIFGLEELKTLATEEKDSIHKLGSLWNEAQKFDKKVEKKWNLGNYIGDLVGPAARQDQGVFLRTWRKGVCSKLLNELDEIDLKIEAFLATVDHPRAANFIKIKEWIAGIEACKSLLTDAELSNVWQYVRIIE